MALRPGLWERTARTEILEQSTSVPRICALLRDFDKHGEKAIARLKVTAMVLPRQHKVEHTNPLSRLSDEQLEAMIEHLKASLEAQAQSAVIDGELVDAAALPAPDTRAG